MSPFSTQSPDEVLDDFGAKDDVLTEETQDDRVVSLRSAVATAHSIATQHYQIATDIIARVLEQVMQGEAVARL